MIDLEGLHHRISRLTAELEQLSYHKLGYEYMLDILNKNPAHTEAYVSELQRYCDLAKQQVADLVVHRKNKFTEADKNKQV